MERLPCPVTISRSDGTALLCPVEQLWSPNIVLPTQKPKPPRTYARPIDTEGWKVDWEDSFFTMKSEFHFAIFTDIMII